MTLAAGTQIGKYVVREKLAEGGMAEIYLCAARGPEGFEKEVVIKRVRSFLASDPGFVQMFIAEARVASRLNHANVVQIFDFAKHEDTYYLAMELVRGCSLWELRRRCKEQLTPMPPVLVAQMGAEVARGLHYAHRLRDADGAPLHLVHRDVTPQNVLLSFDGAVKLTDFGIAKAGKSFTAPGMLKGKFAYMSPEQARGEDVDARTDVFALGVVLWEMLTGGRLFEGDSEVAVLRAVQHSAIPPPARLNPDVPAELDAVVRKALERDVSARYQSAFELERALAEVTLRHAKSVDDTDLGAFVRRVYGIAFTQTLPAVTDRAPASAASGNVAPREPTAVMAGATPRAGGDGRAVSPDEDIHAPTHVVSRRESPPTEPMPSVGSSPGTLARALSSAPLSGAGAEPMGARTPSGPVQSVASALSGPPHDVPPAPSPGPVHAVAPSSSLPPPATTRGGERSAAGTSRRAGWWVGLAGLGLAAVVGAGVLLRPGAGPAVAQPAPGERAGMEGPAVAQPAPAKGATPEDTPVQAPEPVKPTPMEAATAQAAPPAAKAQGHLVVRAIPFATVMLNGKTLGEVQGRASFALAPGQYKLTFVHPAATKSYSVTVEPNGLVQREFRASAPR
ncbi:protein kinase [Myxococcaceae bacterium GXIMD 01537]